MRLGPEAVTSAASNEHRLSPAGGASHSVDAFSGWIWDFWLYEAVRRRVEVGVVLTFCDV